MIDEKKERWIDEKIHQYHKKGYAYGGILSKNIVITSIGLINQVRFIDIKPFRIINHAWKVEDMMRKIKWNQSFEEFVNRDYITWRSSDSLPPLYYDKVPITEEYYDIRFSINYSPYIEGRCGYLARILSNRLKGKIMGLSLFSEDEPDHFVVLAKYKGEEKYIDATGVYRNYDMLAKVWKSIESKGSGNLEDIEFYIFKVDKTMMDYYGTIREISCNDKIMADSIIKLL